MTLIVLAVALILLVRGTWWVTRVRFRGRSTSHFMLTWNRGETPDVHEAARFGAEIVNTLLKGRGSLVMHRWVSGGVTQVAVTLVGVPHPAKFAAQLARDLGGEATRVSDLDLPQPCHFVVATTKSDSGMGVEGSVAAYSQRVTAALENVGSDAAVSVAIEPMSPRKVKALLAFVGHREEKVGRSAQAHPFFANKALAKVTVYGGADTPDAAQAVSTQPLGFLPGFAQDVDATEVAPTRVAAWSLATGFALATTTFVTHASFWWYVPSAAAVIGGVLLMLKVINPFRHLLTQALQDGLVPTAVELPQVGQLLRSVKVVAKGVLGLKFQGARNPTAPANPLAGTQFAATPSQVFALLTLDTGAAASVASEGTTKAPAPAQATKVDGLRLGYDVAGRAVYLPDEDREAGIFVCGDPGKGKTQTLLGLWTGDLIARKTGTPKNPAPLRNGDMTLLWWETKGEGARRAMQAALRAGYTPGEVEYISVTSDEGPRLELFDRDNVDASVQAFVNALTYALPAGSIMGASRDVLVRSLRLALLAPTEVVNQAISLGYLEQDNPIEFMFVLLGGRVTGDAQKGLYGLLKAAATQPHEQNAQPQGSDFAAAFAALTEQPTPSVRSDLLNAVEDFGHYMGKPERERRSDFAASLNKVTLLKDVPNLWHADPSRPVITLSQLITSHRVAIVNFGPEPGHGSHVEGTAELLAALALHLTWGAMVSNCDGWQASSRSVGFYCDELATITGGGDDSVVAAMFDRGRSFGLQLVVATQRPHQLPDRVRQAVGGAGTLIYLGLSNTQVARDVMDDLASEASPYSVEDLRNLPPREAIARIRIHGRPQRIPFTLLVPHEEDVTVETYLEESSHA